jgi:hypothetical protein
VECAGRQSAACLVYRPNATALIAQCTTVFATPVDWVDDILGDEVLAEATNLIARIER